MKRINVIKYIEKQTKKDLWDFQEIILILDGDKYTHKPLYHFSKKGPYMYESIYRKGLENKSQIFNRMQKIRQDGYYFKKYMTTIGMEKLIIAFE